MQAILKATPILVKPYDFKDKEGKEVKFTKIFFVDEGEGTIVEINTTKTEAIKELEKSLNKPMDVPVKFTVQKGGLFKISLDV